MDIAGILIVTVASLLTVAYMGSNRETLGDCIFFRIRPVVYSWFLSDVRPHLRPIRRQILLPLQDDRFQWLQDINERWKEVNVISLVAVVAVFWRVSFCSRGCLLHITYDPFHYSLDSRKPIHSSFRVLPETLMTGMDITGAVRFEEGTLLSLFLFTPTFYSKH